MFSKRLVLLICLQSKSLAHGDVVIGLSVVHTAETALWCGLMLPLCSVYVTHRGPSRACRDFREFGKNTKTATTQKRTVQIYAFWTGIIYNCNNFTPSGIVSCKQESIVRIMMMMKDYIIII